MRESQHRRQDPPAKCRSGDLSRGAQPSSTAADSGGALLATRPVAPPQCPVGVRWHARFQKRCSHFQSCPHCYRFQATVSSVRRRPKTREDWRCAVWLQPKQLAPRMFLLKSLPLRQCFFRVKPRKRLEGSKSRGHQGDTRSRFSASGLPSPQGQKTLAGSR